MKQARAKDDRRQRTEGRSLEGKKMRRLEGQESEVGSRRTKDEEPEIRSRKSEDGQRPEVG